ncbi:Chitin biosynthesis protein CHS5 [Candida viswanathii]|uniref:Chitin biosynthesis protein CHS5 n=1 Tax=Candida viswanathii TaxID=5486 RepID=A0A367YLX7_9ASCO|nr:Chitin biosynthesis protein CHS5 [Candida viswanathii]
MVEVSLTVGKLDASLALLLTKDHHLIEFPTILLPNGVRAGSIIKIKCDQDFESEKEEAAKFNSIQEEILNTFATNLPEPPNLKIKNVTQTSCVLEWDKLNLGTSNLKNLILFKDGKKLGSIPQPLSNRTSKLSGLPIDKSFKVQLRLDTTAGVFLSNEIEVTTHKMTDLSGITVCLGDLTPNDQFNKQDIEDTLKNMGAKFPAQTQVKVDTTHFLCTRENKQNPEYVKANDMNIPIIRPEWLKACERERRIVGVRDFYVKECVLPDLFAKNYWQKNNATAATAVATTNDATAEDEHPPVPEKEVEKLAAEEPASTEPASEVPVEETTKEAEASKPEETSNEGEEPPKEEDAAAEPAPAGEVQSDSPKDTEELAKEPEADLTEASAPLEETEAEPEVPVINVEPAKPELAAAATTEEPAKEENLNEEETEPVDVEETKQAIDDAFDSVPLEDENAATEESKPVEQEARDGDLAEAKELETAPVIGNGGNKENEEENGEENGEEDGEEDGDEDDDGEDENEDEAVPTEGTPTPAGDKKKKKKKKNKNKGKK